MNRNRFWVSMLVPTSDTDSTLKTLRLYVFAAPARGDYIRVNGMIYKVMSAVHDIDIGIDTQKITLLADLVEEMK